VFPSSDKRYGADDPVPVFWGGGGYPTLWNEAPFHNNQDLFVLKDDYSQVFGKHFVKFGVLGSTNKKNEDAGGGAPSEVSQFWGAAGLNGWGASTGNTLGNFLLRDMTWGFSETNKEARAQLRWKDIELYAADSWKAQARLTIDYGVRYSYFPNPYQTSGDATAFNPASFDPALGGDPCNGLVYQPQLANPCAAHGFLGGTPAPDKSLLKNPSGLFAPRVGVAWDLSGDGRTAVRAGLGLFYVRERLSPSLGLAANPPFAISVAGIRKLDTTTEPCGGCFGSASFGHPASGRNTDGRDPHNLQWNVAVQHELFRNTTLELAYVGNKGSDLLKSEDINQIPGDLRLAYVQAQGNTAAQGALRPYNVWGDSRITFWDHTGDSIYHSLQTQLVSRFKNGSQFQMSYTWSRAIATDPLDNSNGGLDKDVAWSDLSNHGLDRALAKTNRTHVFNASLVLNLPKLEGQSGFAKTVFGDWQMGSIVQAETGTPLTVYAPNLGVTNTTTGPNGISGPSGTGFPDNNRPNRVVDQPCHVSGSVKEQWLNPAAFTMTGFQLGTIGNASRGVCNGPGLFQTDISLYKNLHLSQKLTAQLRFDVFNVFDTVNFIANGGNGINATFDPSVTVNSNAIATATEITGTNLASTSTFGRAVAARDPRQAQFAIKLMF